MPECRTVGFSAIGHLFVPGCQAVDLNFLMQRNLESQLDSLRSARQELQCIGVEIPSRLNAKIDAVHRLLMHCALVLNVEDEHKQRDLLASLDELKDIVLGRLYE